MSVSIPIARRYSYVGLEIIGKIAEVLEIEPAELMRLPIRRRKRGND
jgi:hypothetical protein